MTTPPPPDDPSASDEALDALSTLPTQLDPSIPIDPGAIAFAYHYYAELCCGEPKSRAQATKALAALSRAWRITDTGDLLLPGSGTDTYRVSSFCCVLDGQYTTNKKTGKHGQKLCKGWTYAGGGCYHRAAFEILRIAQYADQLI
jgi:hypothetical protein